jgi:hypothetical protein
MKLLFRPLSLGAPRHPLALCALLAPNNLSLSNLGSNCRSSLMQTTEKSILRSLFSCVRTCSRSPFDNPNTIEFA